jgi:hypothetical protein
MTRDDIIKLAREAGYQHPDAVGTCEDFAYFDLERFAALVAQRERDELVVMFLEAHEGAKTAHNYWAVAANKIKERNV